MLDVAEHADVASFTLADVPFDQPKAKCEYYFWPLAHSAKISKTCSVVQLTGGKWCGYYGSVQSARTLGMK